MKSRDFADASRNKDRVRELAVRHNGDVEAYPVFCTISVEFDESPRTSFFSALRRESELRFVGDIDRPFTPDASTALISEAGDIEFRGHRLRFAALLRALDEALRRGGLDAEED